MYRYFLGALIGFMVAFLVFAAWVANAEERGPKAYLYNKPVLCGSTLQEAMDMLSQIKSDGMTPLMYFRGNSFNGDNSKFFSDIFILFDPLDDQVTIVERQDSGFTCILSGGTGEVEFDPGEIESIFGWSDIK